MSTNSVDVPVAERLNIDMRSEETPLGTSSSVCPSYEHITIFDFDDTLLPSSWLIQVLQTRGELSDKMKEEMHKLDESAYALLSTALRLSSVLIITNAEAGWIRSSCSMFMPLFHSLLKYVTIVSARSRYEEKYPYDCGKWKELTFRDEIEKLRKEGSFVSLLSIGDSLYERNAALLYGSTNKYSIIKSVKMIELPTPGQLITQQRLICNAIPSMIKNREKLDLKLSVEVSI